MKKILTLMLLCAAVIFLSCKKTEPVEIPISGVKLNKATSTLVEGSKETLVATVLPKEADQTVTWASSDTQVAIVSDNGEVKALKVGVVNITATSKVDRTQWASCVITVTDNVIPVQSVKLDKDKMDIAIGDKSVLMATVLPEGAGQSLTWTTSDAAIATVSEGGEVTGVKDGMVAITASSASDPSKQAICIVTVVANAVRVESMKLNKTASTLLIGDKETFVAIIAPKNATNQDVTWTSSDKEIATVSNTGEVTGLKSGVVTISVASDEDPAKSASCKITVTDKLVPVESIVLDRTKLAIDASGKVLLLAVIMPTYASQSVEWTSSDEAVATVSKGGEVTGVNAGVATITATSITDQTKSASCEVTVKMNPTTAININSTYDVTVGGLTIILPTYVPMFPADKIVKWTSSDEAVVTVSQKGQIVGVKAGTARVAVNLVSNPAVMDTCIVTVTGGIAVTSIELNKTVSEIGLNGVETLKATILPREVGQLVTWTSSDQAVAPVSAVGVVTGLKEGTATITATSIVDPTKTATCNVTVKTSNTDIYISGYKLGSDGTTRATIWHNGVASDWSNGVLSNASSVYVSGNDVYASGYVFKGSNSVGTVWKNGTVLYSFGNGLTYGTVSSIYVVGSDVYAGGYERNKKNETIGKIWKNGTELYALTRESGGINTVCVSGSDVYAVGVDSAFVQKVWKNGAELYKLTDGTKVSTARDMCVVGSDVYVSGQLDGVAKVWKNGVASQTNYGRGELIAIAVKDGVVYVAGRVDSSTAYWKGNTKTFLTYDGTIYGMGLFGDDLYMVGFEYMTVTDRAPAMWKNSVPTYLDGGGTVTGIFVKQR